MLFFILFLFFFLSPSPPPHVYHVSRISHNRKRAFVEGEEEPIPLEFGREWGAMLPYACYAWAVYCAIVGELVWQFFGIGDISENG
jgi:hypothetical protein